jgi:disulfide bond formation protein DsbB
MYHINVIYIAWIQSVIATLGSLYLSEIANMVPCKLCWFQRIAMYPLVFLFSVGLIKKDKNVVYYTLPISITGLLISIYHNIYYFGYIKEQIVSCTTDTPCNLAQLKFLGLLDIPQLALIAFLVINICSITYIYRERRKKFTEGVN